jgi:hypothetical protein
MRLTSIVAALGLSACASTPTMESALAPLTGQPVQLVVEQLGPPSSYAPAGADTVYEWRRAKTVSGAIARGGTMATAPSDGAPAYGASGSVVAVPYTCDVWILADAEGLIKDSQFGEQTGGCRESARKLRQLALAESPPRP